MKKILSVSVLVFIFIFAAMFCSCKKNVPTLPAVQNTMTGTETATFTRTQADAATVTATFTHTATVTGTYTHTETATVTETSTLTETLTATPTCTETFTQTVTETATATITPTNEPACTYQFGYTTNDENSSWGSDWLVGNKFVPGSGMYISRLTIKLTCPAGLYAVGIYTDNAGSPSALLAETGILNASAGWVNGYITPTLLNAGTTYWIVAISDNSCILSTFGTANTGKNGAYPWASVVSSGMPATLGALSNGNYDMKIQAATCP
jgi:hypothetical protein